MSGFKTSSRYGIVGVIVVMVLVALIGINSDPTDPNPKGTFLLIFGILAVFLIGLFFFQTRDLNKAEAGSVSKTVTGPQEVDDPTKMSDADLWASLAVKDIDKDALEARGEMWGSTRSSIHLAMLVCLLIFLAVPPIYLFDTFVPLMIGAPLIMLAAVWGSIRVLMSGGEIDQAYERSDRAMQPLGLSMTERPEVGFEPRMPPMWGANARLRGPLILQGKRHGHSVIVHQEGNESSVTVRGAVPAFEAKARDGRIKADKDSDGAIESVLAEIPNSTRWKGVKVHGGRNGVVVERKSNLEGWLCDLWLAERLASKL
jgi:hypothetical protein